MITNSRKKTEEMNGQIATRNVPSQNHERVKVRLIVNINFHGLQGNKSYMKEISIPAEICDYTQ
jgi:hypothetical protein